MNIDQIIAEKEAAVSALQGALSVAVDLEHRTTIKRRIRSILREIAGLRLKVAIAR